MVKASDRHVRMERRTDARGRSFITKRHPCHITVLHKKNEEKKRRRCPCPSDRLVDREWPPSTDGRGSSALPCHAACSVSFLLRYMLRSINTKRPKKIILESDRISEREGKVAGNSQSHPSQDLPSIDTHMRTERSRC
jgi:hypothetical protein